MNRTIPEPSAGHFDDAVSERLKKEPSRSATELGWTPPTETPFQMLKRMNRERRQGKPRP